MSDFVRHECGLALVRLRQPLTYYRERYGDAAWGLRRLYLLMEKQHNRGQDGAGMAVVKFDMPAGESFLRRVRSDEHNALEHIFDRVMRDVRGAPNRRNAEQASAEATIAARAASVAPPGAAERPTQEVSALERTDDADSLRLRRRHRYVGEIYLGHLRYGTHSGNAKSNCHPFVRRNNTASRNLAVAGNFNMTNAAELFRQLVEYGLSPVGESDTNVILERVGYFLDREHDYLRSTMGPESFLHLEGNELAR